MRFIRAGVTSNEAPAAERAEPPVHFYQVYYAHYIHTSGQRVQSSARVHAGEGNEVTLVHMLEEADWNRCLCASFVHRTDSQEL